MLQRYAEEGASLGLVIAQEFLPAQQPHNSFPSQHRDSLFMIKLRLIQTVHDVFLVAPFAVALAFTTSGMVNQFGQYNSYSSCL